MDTAPSGAMVLGIPCVDPEHEVEPVHALFHLTHDSDHKLGADHFRGEVHVVEVQFVLGTFSDQVANNPIVFPAVRGGPFFKRHLGLQMHKG